MGLDLALHTAVAGLHVSQENLSTLSSNIANANTPDYARRMVRQISQAINGIDIGPKIASITRQIDDFLVVSVRQQGTSVGEKQVIDDYYSRIQNLLGQPSSDSSLSAAIDKFFSSLRSLSVNPELSSLRLNAVNDATNLVNKLGGLANDLESLRLEADRQVSATIGYINQHLDALHELNPAIRTAQNSGLSDADLVEKQDVLLRELAEKIDISFFKNAAGEVTITTASGISLLDENRKQLLYSPAGSVNTFINGSKLGAITVQSYRDDGKAVGIPETLVSSGPSGELTSYIKGGELNGLLEIRDSIVPNILDQLDNLAFTLTEKVNAIHNDGAGFPPPTTLTGTTAIIPSEEHQFSGSVRIALVGADGKPVESPYTDGETFPPLTLDLASLDNGQGNSRPDIQTIIDEINTYYGPPQQRAALGPLADIRLASRTDTLGPQAGFPTDSTFTFDFEMENSLSDDLTFEVLNVSVPETGATGLTSILPGPFTLSGGERTRTGAANSITVDFNGVAVNGPYTIRATVKVTNSQGISFLSTIDYEVPNNVTGAYNDRIPASSVFAGDADIIAPTTSQRFLTAELVDANGNPAAPNTPAYLRLRTNTSAGDYRIAIDELDSKELGQPDNATAVPATNRGFSHFLGLNNFFVENNATTITGSSAATVAGSAVKLAIRSDIKENPNLISLGELTQSNLTQTIEKVVTVGTIKATASLQFLGNPAPGDSLNINGSIFTFVAGPPGGSNQIQVGGTLAQTVLNVATALNANNAFTQGNAALATYGFNGTDTINISYDTPGLEGNAFQIAVDLTTSTQSAVINGAAASQTASGTLLGGEDGTATLTSNQLYTYELGSGSNQIVKRLSELGLSNISFNSAGGLPASTFTLSRYGAEIIGFTSTKATNASATFQQAQELREGFIARLEAGSGVNLDEELANVVLFQNAYSASAQVIRVTGELFDILFDSI